MWGKIIELEKRNKKLSDKDKWETPYIIPLTPLLGVNYCQHILNKSKIMVHCYSTDETVNQFAIGYIINPSITYNKVFIIQAEKCLSLSFTAIRMETIKYFLRNNNKCVMALIMIYENNGEKPKKGIEC